MTEQETILKGMYEAVVAGDDAVAADFARKSIDAGIPAITSLHEGLTAGIKEIGDRFGAGELYLPEMVMAADAMEAAVEVLQPYLGDAEIESKGTVVIATVKGDIHDIGKNIAAAVLGVNGYNVVDVGRDVSPEAMVDAAIANDADIVGMSALMTTSLPYLAETIELMQEDGVRDQFKVVIGGGPTNQRYADEIGADGYGNTAMDAVVLCDRLAGIEAGELV